MHIELKRRGVDIKDAFNQINRYQNDSFWAGSGLYEFVQIFVISNGFDATTLNTLWVDKNLRMQGLLQAFSRTNRILNAVKAFGNIVCFRNLEEATNKSLALFGDKEAGGIVLLKTFAEYYNGYTDDKGKYVKGYKELIEELEEKYPAGELIVSEKEKRSFVKLYGAILRLKNNSI